MRNVLLTPGPTNVPAAVAAALGQTDHSHRDEVIIDALTSLRHRLVDLLGGDAAYTCLPLPCAGTGAIEAMVRGVRGRLLVLDAGRYSRRAAELAARCGVAVELLAFDPWSGIDVGRVDDLLGRRPELTDVLVVHLETTTGELAPLRDLGEVVHARGRHLLVDAVSSAFGHPIDLGRDRITALVATPNKCLEGVPGLALVVAATPWLDGLAGRARSYYLDLHEHALQLRRGGPLFTISPGLIAATGVAVERTVQEGVERRSGRYRGLRDELRRRLAAAGLVVRRPAHDSNIITVFALPAELDAATLVAGMARAGFVVHSHVELTAAGLFGVATLGDLSAADLARFTMELASLRVAAA